jgi:hypothetical protein
MEQPTLSNIQEQLIAALEKSKAASKTLEEAQGKLAPLEAKAHEAQQHVTKLMSDYNRLTGNTPMKGRRGSAGSKKVYNQTPESKIASQEKRSYTRAINNGSSEAEAKKIAKEAAKALAVKLGVK